MNNSFKEENGEVLLWDTYDHFKLNQLIIPGFTAKVGTVKEVGLKIGDWVWPPSHGCSDAACWNTVDWSFLKAHESNPLTDNYRYVFLLKNQ